MSIKHTLAGLALAAAALLPATASTLYGTAFAGLTPLYTLDQGTGALGTVGDTGAMAIGDLTSDTRAGSFTLWGMRIADNELVTLDAATGAVTGSVALDSNDDMVSIAFDAVSGRLYGNTSVSFGAAFDALYEIDPTTGATSFIGRILFQDVFALAFDQTGQLFGIADATDELITISTATGNGALVGSVDVGFAFDIASRPEDNVMFLSDSGTTSLYRIDTATGATTLVGPYGAAANIAGLAFGPGAAVPVPGSLGLAALGLVALGAQVRRRR